MTYNEIYAGLLLEGHDATDVLAQGARVDPYFERGGFLMPAPLGQRVRTRDWLRRIAAEHTPPLRILVNSGDWHSRRRNDVLSVLVIS